MEWSDEELSDVMSRGSSAAPTGIRVPALPASTLKAMMTRAVELAAARGGTMTAEDLTSVWCALKDNDFRKTVERLQQHIAALGARNAVLEAENVECRRLLATRVDAVRLDEAIAQVESIRQRSLEAGNLERLISEHGLPAAMRWVVDGEEPSAAHSCDETCTHSGVDDTEMLRRDKDGWPPLPCSSTCTHDDAATPDHSERVKKKSEAVERATFRDGRDEGYTEGSEAMRAACLKDVREALANVGAWDRETERIVASAIEGATP